MHVPIRNLGLLFSLGGSMLRSIAKCGKTSEHRTCSNIFWAMAKLDQRMSAELASLRSDSLSAVKATVSHINAQGASNIVWAFAVLQLPQADRDEVLAAVTCRLGPGRPRCFPACRCFKMLRKECCLTSTNYILLTFFGPAPS